MLISNYLKNEITRKAQELGFCAIGFVRTEILEKESEYLSKWISSGFASTMQWIEKSYEKRRDIRNIMPEAKSVISLAYNYYYPHQINSDNPKISIYAKGKDYHIIIKEKLNILSEYISKLSENVIIKYYTDDGPIMEKVWAEKAGIGWQGKHSNIINNDYGSWIFLSEILTNIEFDEYSVPMEDLCGSCRICIDACPTNAIVADSVVDSNLCISYQTIENKSELPEHFNFQGWIYGCDICQEVCPFNKNDRITFEEGFLSKPEIDNKNDKELRDITEEQFKLIFKDSPIKRTKHKGWLRNLEKFSKDNNIL